MSQSVIYNDIIDCLLRFTNKKVQLNSIKTCISGIENAFFFNPNPIYLVHFYKCQYNLEGSSAINIIHIDLYYKNGKLHRDECSSPAVIIRSDYIDNYGEIWKNGNLKKIIKWNKSL